jgi:hypothetical protein
VNRRWVKIPEQFHSLYHEGLFPRCVDCDRDLLVGDCDYWIERVFRGTEPICEMAMCSDCRMAISEELSQDSLMRINAFVEERFDMEARYEKTLAWPGKDIELWLDRCIFTKKPAGECPNYQIAGLCRGRHLSIDLLPIMISDDAIEEMQKLMSKKTRERLGEMVQDFFGMPSEFIDGPEKYSPFLL